MVDVFKLVIVVLQTAFMIIKINLNQKHIGGDNKGNEYQSSIQFFLGINAFVLLLPLIWAGGFLDNHNLMIPISPVIRWVAVLVFGFNIMLMVWQMRALSVNISSNHEDRYLVTSGPYKYVRHPLYLIFILLSISCAIISANLVLLAAVIPTIIAGKIRANYEESILIKEYGQAYKKYQQNTGQLFPNIR